MVIPASGIFLVGVADLNNYFKLLITVSVLFLGFMNVSGFVYALSSVDPRIMSEVMKLSPAERQKLARTYGVDLGNSGNPNSTTSENYQLGEKGTTLVPFEGRAETDEGEFDIFDFQLDPDSEVEGEDSELKVYGIDFFDSEISTFTQLDDVAVQGLCGWGWDSINLSLIGKSMDLTLDVNRGKIILPNIGALSVVGCSILPLRTSFKLKLRSICLGPKYLYPWDV